MHIGITAMGGGGASSRVVTIPYGLGWPSDSRFDLGQITVYNSPSRGGYYAEIGVTPEALFDRFSTARSAPAATYYVNVTTGNNANNGLSSGAAKKSIWSAVNAANAGGVPAKIFVSAGFYPMADGFTNNGSYVRPTVDIAYIATGGEVLTGPFTAFSAPSRDGTYTNCYTISTATTVSRIFDRVSTHPTTGYYDELESVDTIARCNATPGSWIQSGGVIYINRADNAAVTNTNTRVFFDNENFAVAADISVYMGGETSQDFFNLEGGKAAGPVTVAPSSPSSTVRASVFKGVLTSYGAVGQNGASVDSVNGLVAFFDCELVAPSRDGFNLKNQVGAYAGKTFMLTVNCTVRFPGRRGNTSCNAWTLHEDTTAIDICGFYPEGRGGTVHNVYTTKSCLLYTFSGGDMGDSAFGGSIKPAAFKVVTAAHMWMEGCVIDGPMYMYGIDCGSGCTVLTRNMPKSPFKINAEGTIGTY